MLFGKRDKKKPTERVLDLKARVDAMRQVDEAEHPKGRSFDLFLEGDDVLTSRDTEDHYQPSGFDPQRPPAAEVDFEAELAKYLKREEDRAASQDDGAPQETGNQSEAPANRPQVHADWSSTRSEPDAGSDSPPGGPAEPGDELPRAPLTREWGTPQAWPGSADWPAEDAWPPPPRQDERSA